MDAGANAMQTMGHGTHDASCGGQLVAVDGRPLPLEETRLEVVALGGVARTVLLQRFRNPHAEPLRVTYKLPLPADGAVAGFAFTLADERVTGVVEGRAQARERFERALLEGHSAALLEQERASLFTQQVGNVPPGGEVTCEVHVDQKLLWRAEEGGWEWRFPTVVAPRYAGAPGRVPDARAVFTSTADGELATRTHLSLTLRDALAEGARPESPSHPVRVQREARAVTVSLAEDAGARLDRDVVVRWRVATPGVGLSLEVAAASLPGHAGAAHALLTVVPPQPERRLSPVPRDLIVLLDTSGSMSGEPLAQACRVASALVDSLGEEDRLELVEFSDAPRRWRRGAVEATVANKQKARAWLASLRASGGTEMHAGILEALRPLSADAQRQVVLVTDGLIGFEREVVSAILEALPSGARVHTVGVGSAVNRALTHAAARAGRGVEVVVGLGEDAERAAQALLAHTGAPQVVELQVSGPALLEHAPSRLPDLFAGAPALLSLKVRPEGGTLTVEGRTREGRFTRTVQVPAAAQADGPAALAALFARERVEDLEMERAGGAPGQELDARIEALGVQYQVSTRLTSWVAVSRGRTVDPSAPGRTVEMPHALPHGLSVEGLGLRAAAPTGSRGELPLAAPVAMVMAAPPGRLGRAVEHTYLGDFLDAEPEVAVPEAALELSLPAPPPAFPAPKALRADRPRRRLAPGFRPSPPQEEGTGDVGGRTRPVRTGRARLLPLDAAHLVATITLADAFTFEPGRPVALRLRDGRVVTAEVVAERSTRAGPVAAGLELRVTLRLSSPLAADALAALVLTDAAGELHVTVEA